MRPESFQMLVPATPDLGWGLVAILVVGALAGLLLTALWSIVASRRLTTAGRLLWVAVVLALPVLGTAAWFAWGRHVPLDRDLI